MSVVQPTLNRAGEEEKEEEESGASRQQLANLATEDVYEEVGGRRKYEEAEGCS